jgi:hypothetical protein
MASPVYRLASLSLLVLRLPRHLASSTGLLVYDLDRRCRMPENEPDTSTYP